MTPPRNGKQPRRFVLVIEAMAHVDAVLALRSALKRLRRNHGLRCLSVTAAPRPGKRKINRMEAKP